MDFEQFHVRDVPALIADGRGKAAARDIGDGRSITLRSPSGAAFTYRAQGGDIRLEPGEGVDVVVELSSDAFDDLLSEAWSVFGLLYGDRVTVRRGEFNAFARWEAPLQALWFGRPIYGADTVAAFRDVDVTRAFTLDDDDAQLRRFLGEAGFLVLRGVFARDEIDQLNAIVADELTRSVPGDGRSWWATRSDGEEV